MVELLFQESYIEWILPLTIAVIWILGWQLFSLTNSVQANGKLDASFQSDIYTAPMLQQELPLCLHHDLIKTIKKKVCPDNDSEGPHLLLIKDKL